VNSDGTVDKADGRDASHKFFKFDSQKCQAVLDVGGYPQTYIPDGFWTSQDLHIFVTEVKKGVINFPVELICEDECFIPNHMQK